MNERRRGTPWQDKDTDPVTGAASADLGAREAQPQGQLTPQQAEVRRAGQGGFATTNAQVPDSGAVQKAQSVADQPAASSYQDMRAQLSKLNQEARAREDSRRSERKAEAAAFHRQRKQAAGPERAPHQRRAPRPGDSRAQHIGQRRSDAREREGRMARLQRRQGNLLDRLRQRLRRKQQEQEEERRSLLDRLQDARLERQRRQEQLELAKTFRAERDKLERRNRTQRERYQPKVRRSEQPNRSRELLTKRMRVRADAKLREERERLEKRYHEERERIERKFRERRAKTRGKAPNSSPSRVRKLIKMLKGRAVKNDVHGFRLRHFRLRRLRFRRQRVRRQRLRLERRGAGLKLRRNNLIQRKRQLRLERQRYTRRRQVQQRRVRRLSRQRERVNRERRVRQDHQRQQRIRQDHSRRQRDQRQRARQDRNRRDRDRRGGW